MMRSVRSKTHFASSSADDEGGEEVERDGGVAVLDILLPKAGFEVVDVFYFGGDRVGLSVARQYVRPHEFPDLITYATKEHFGNACVLERRLAHIGVEIGIVNVEQAGRAKGNDGSGSIGLGDGGGVARQRG